LDTYQCGSILSTESPQPRQCHQLPTRNFTLPGPKSPKNEDGLHRKTTHGKLNTARKTAIGLIPLQHPTVTQLSPNEDSSEHHQKSKTETTPKPPPIFISNVTTISPLIQLLEHIAKQYEIEALSGNQIGIQPKTPDAYRTIVKALEEKNTNFHTSKPKDERSYRAVLKNMHFSIDPAEIKYEIGNLGHTVTNIYNIRQNKTKLPLPMFFCGSQTCPKQ
jgi:hypothetical protein